MNKLYYIGITLFAGSILLSGLQPILSVQYKNFEIGVRFLNVVTDSMFLFIGLLLLHRRIEKNLNARRVYLVGALWILNFLLLKYRILDELIFAIVLIFLICALSWESSRMHIRYFPARILALFVVYMTLLTLFIFISNYINNYIIYGLINILAAKMPLSIAGFEMARIILFSTGKMLYLLVFLPMFLFMGILHSLAFGKERS